jgi:tryptophan halogenase
MGNSFGFVEPLEATSLAAICAQAQGLAETLRDSDGVLGPCLIKQYNKRDARNWDTIRKFLALHFKFAEALDTPYWQACRADADLGGADEIVEYYRDNGPSVLARATLLEQGDQFNMEGYLSMLVGQQVPHSSKFTPDERERVAWQKIRQSVYNQAARAYSVAEALSLIRSANWVWPAEMYR